MLKIVELFHVSNVTEDHLMLCVFPKLDKQIAGQDDTCGKYHYMGQCEGQIIEQIVNPQELQRNGRDQQLQARTG